MNGYYVYDPEINEEFIIIPARNFATIATKELIEQFLCGRPRLEEMEGGSFTIKEYGRKEYRVPMIHGRMETQALDSESLFAAEFGTIIARRYDNIIEIYEPDIWTDRLIGKGIIGGHTI